MRLAIFDVTLDIVSPLHIGSGEELEPDADFVEEREAQRRVARIIDVDGALMEMDESELQAIQAGRIAAALGERRRTAHTKAVLPVRGPGRLSRVRALQRLADGRPYIPGTTVKGSIRTALLRALVKARPALLNEVPPQERSRPQQAARQIEEKAFGLSLQGKGREAHFENRDLNRAIRVSDFLPEGEASVAVANMSAHRLGRSEQQRPPIPIWCEAIDPGARFAGTIAIETNSPVWESMAPDQQELVNYLFRSWSDAGRELITAEREAWALGPAGGRDFYDALARDQRFLVVLGWGSGWRSKTLGTALSPQKLQEVATMYGLNRWQGRDFPERFPVTRKLAESPRGPAPPGRVAFQATLRGA